MSEKVRTFAPAKHDRKVHNWEYSSAGSERLPYKQEVTGSIPVTPTFFFFILNTL